jgi:hypothetical protein
MLGFDRVLCRSNAARDTVTDHVQPSPQHVAEFIANYPAEAREMWTGVGGRAVTSAVQLWAIPEEPSTFFAC